MEEGEHRFSRNKPCFFLIVWRAGGAMVDRHFSFFLFSPPPPPPQGKNLFFFLKRIFFFFVSTRFGGGGGGELFFVVLFFFFFWGALGVFFWGFFFGASCPLSLRPPTPSGPVHSEPFLFFFFPLREHMVHSLIHRGGLHFRRINPS